MTYTPPPPITQAMGEMLLRQVAETHNLPVSIIRPSIVESALEQPHTGWMEGIRMADPIILAFGKGHMDGFVGDRHGVLDIVPVDTVINAMLAACAAQANAPGVQVYHVATSVLNPLATEQFTVCVWCVLLVWGCLLSVGVFFECGGVLGLCIFWVCFVYVVGIVCVWQQQQQHGIRFKTHTLIIHYCIIILYSSTPLKSPLVFHTHSCHHKHPLLSPQTPTPVTTNTPTHVTTPLLTTTPTTHHPPFHHSLSSVSTFRKTPC